MLWRGHGISSGYGMFNVVVAGKRTQVLAHRWAYEECWGPIPEGLEISHLCRQKRCVNPDHLKAVTRQENVWRSHGATAKTFACGHPRTPENTRMSLGSPVCRQCAQRRSRESYQRYKPKRRAEAKANYWKDPEASRARNRAQYQKHRPKRLAEMRAYRAHNPEKFRADRKRYYADHREEILAKQRTDQRWRRLTPTQREAARRTNRAWHYRKKQTAARAAWEAYERAQLAMLGVAALPHAK
jgi:hypothetical protein